MEVYNENEIQKMESRIVDDITLVDKQSIEDSIVTLGGEINTFISNLEVNKVENDNNKDNVA